MLAAEEVLRRGEAFPGARRRPRLHTGIPRENLTPRAANAGAVALEQLAEGDAHRLFDDAGLVDMAADLEQLGAPVVVVAPEAVEPRRPAPQDRRRDRDALDIVHRGRAAIEAGAGR